MRPTPLLANLRSDRVRAVRALSGRSARVRHGQFLVEGPQAVREAVRFASGAIRDIYLSESAVQRYPEIVGDAQAADLYVHEGTAEVLDAMSADAQGVLAVLRRDLLDLSLERALDAAGGSTGRPALLVAVLANVRDPGNAGTVIRAADAAGADLVVLVGQSVAADNPKLVRSTAGSLFHLPVITGGELPSVLAELRAAGLAVLAADGAGELDLDDLLDAAGRAGPVGAPGDPGSCGASALPGTGESVNLSAPTAWLFGNEAWGLPPADRELADAVVRVPIHGKAESLNLATAAAVFLYTSARAQRPLRTVPGDETS